MSKNKLGEYSIVVQPDLNDEQDRIIFNGEEIPIRGQVTDKKKSKYFQRDKGEFSDSLQDQYKDTWKGERAQHKHREQKYKEENSREESYGEETHREKAHKEKGHREEKDKKHRNKNDKNKRIENRMDSNRQLQNNEVQSPEMQSQANPDTALNNKRNNQQPTNIGQLDVSPSELRKAIVWAEILGKPVCKTRSSRRQGLK